MTQYVFRLDDICPTMNRQWFERFMELFFRHGVRPLLGIVPDNRDPDLEVELPDPDFWQRMRDLRDRADFAQHGYQHVLKATHPGVLGFGLGVGAKSEFVGSSYEEQRERIAAGRKILQDEGLETDIWMAPGHSFDLTTLSALRHEGFNIVTDGIGLFPESREGLVLVPQQLWRPRHLPAGVGTICIHPNERNAALLVQVDRFLANRAQVGSIREIASRVGPPLGRIANRAFRTALRAIRQLRRARGNRSM